MAAGSGAVLTSFLTNLYIFLGCFGAFSVLRLRPWARRFFAARRYAKDIDLHPKRLPNGLLSWILPVVLYPESDIIDEAGLDAAMYLRILRFGTILSFALTIFCIIVVLPPNMTSNGIDMILAQQALGNDNSTLSVNGNDFKFTDFDHYSLSNVPSASPKMWAHLVASYFVVLFTLWLLWRFNKQSVLLRLLFLGNNKRGGPSHTVLVTDIPGVSEAVSKGLRKEQKLKAKLSRETSGSMTSKKDVEVQADSSYVELAAGPAPPPPPAAIAPPALAGPGPGAARKTKSVSIVEPGQEGKASKPATPGAAPAALPPSVFAQPASPLKGNGHAALDAHDSAPMATPFSMGPPKAIDTDDLPAQRSKSALSQAKSGFSMMSLLSDTKIESNYTLVAEVDPKYAATGGKLEPERIGKSNEEILSELEVIDPPDLLKSLPASFGVDTRPLPPDRRNQKRFQYDMKSTVLDPTRAARMMLKSGLTPQQLVAREFSLVYAPHNVAAVNMIQDTSALEPLAAEYNKVVQKLEDFLEMAKLRLKLRKEVPPLKLTIFRPLYRGFEYLDQFPGKYFAKVDGVEFWLARLRWLRERIKVEQAQAARRAAPSAFVTFNTRMSQAVGANSLHCHDENAWRVQNAPAPFEVVWKNLGMTFPVKSGRLYFLWAAFWAMTLFFMVPVTAIQAIIEVPKLAKIPVLGAIVTAPVVKQFMEAIIPGLVLKIFLALVPTILRFMALLSGATSVSEIDFGVVKRFFLFQVVVVFFGSIIAGSFFNQIQQWVHDPGSVIQTLGKSIPMTSTFFITYLMVNGLGVKSLAFIRLPAFVIFYILSKFAGSPRARMRMWMYQYTNNGTTVVDHTIALLLVLTFSCINPIVCPVGLAYFLVNFIGESYNNIYVFRREYESAGRLWQTVYNQVMVALYIMQLVMLALLIIKKFPYALFLLPLIVFSIGCHLSTLQLFARPWSVTALHDAAFMDLLEADERRMSLLAASREERKKKRDKIKREYDEAVRKAEENDDPLPPYDTRLDETPPPGKAEKLLQEMLEGDGFAMNSEEKREVAEVYMNPAFKLNLDDVERLAKLAGEVQSRLPRLNKWVAEYRHYRREVRRLKLRGETDFPPPPKMPEDLTIFDQDPNLVDSDTDETASTANSNAGHSEPDKSVGQVVKRPAAAGKGHDDQADARV